jgi:hypothetical protein
MKDKNLWFGYLKSSGKNTLVVQDLRLDTGNPKTIYLYDQERNQIVEYNREIIAPRLVEADTEQLNTDGIVESYVKTLRRTKPTTYSLLYATRRTATPAPTPVPGTDVDDSDADYDEEAELDEEIDADEDDKDEDWGDEDEVA